MMNEEKTINNCEEFELLIDGYLDGEILPPEKEQLEKHLGTCISCKLYLNDTAKLIEKTAYLPKEVEIGQNKKDEFWEKIKTVSNKNKNINPAYMQGGWFLRYRYATAAVSAVIVLAVSIFVIGRYLQTNVSGDKVDIKSNVSLGSFWKVSNVKGNPSVDNKLMKTTDSIGIGQWISTDDSSSIELLVSDIGKITIQPKSKVKITKSVNGEHRVQVEYGTIDADIDANPRTFFVDMPSVTAVDLGCSYKLSVDSAGNGLLYVKQGKVSLEAAGKESSLVPAGKFCMTKKDFGPGTPFMGNASPELKRALVDFDFGNCEGSCVNIILKNAKKTDAVTLVSILSKVDDQLKEKVYAKVSGFVAPPRHIPEDSIPNINPECLEQWIEKIQEEVQTKIEKNMEKMQADMEKMGKNMDLNGKDWEEWGKQWEKFGKDFGKDFDKNFQYKFQHVPGHDLEIDIDNNSDDDTGRIDREKLRIDLQEMKKNMEDMKNEFDSEQFKKEMQQSKEEMKRSREDMKRANEEIKKAMKELKKNLNMNLDFNFDTANFKLNIKKTDGDYEYDIHEAPDVPDAPDEDVTPVVPVTPENRLEENKDNNYNRVEPKIDKYKVEHPRSKNGDKDRDEDNDSGNEK